MKQPVIKFMGYQIEKIDYQLLDPLSEETETVIENNEPEVEILNGITENYDQGKVQFLVKYPDKDLLRTIELVVIGYFDIPEETRNNHEKDEIKMYIANNGTAIVYPYVRSILSMITSLDSSGSIIMPTINATDLHKESVKDQISNKMFKED